MNIFENLENLNISEECFNDIMDIVENIIEGWADTHNMGDVRKIARKVRDDRYSKFEELSKKHGINATNQHLIKEIPELKRAKERYDHAHFNSVGSDDAAELMNRYPRRSNELTRETNKAYPDKMKVSQAIKEQPKTPIVKFNVTPSIQKLGKSKKG